MTSSTSVFNFLETPKCGTGDTTRVSQGWLKRGHFCSQSLGDAYHRGGEEGAVYIRHRNKANSKHTEPLNYVNDKFLIKLATKLSFNYWIEDFPTRKLAKLVLPDRWIVGRQMFSSSFNKSIDSYLNTRKIIKNSLWPQLEKNLTALSGDWGVGRASCKLERIAKWHLVSVCVLRLKCVLVLLI
jgi:hypothetical protein